MSGAPPTDPENGAPSSNRPTRRARVRPILRSELADAAEIAGVAGFALVQPVLGPFGESPETFVAAGASPRDIVAFALLVAVVPVVVLAGLAACTRVAGAGFRDIAQTVLVAGLGAAAATVVARQVGAGSSARTLAALVAGALVAVLHSRWEPARMLLRFAAPTPALLAVVFLLASPVAPLVRPSAVEVPAGAGAGDLPPVLFIVLDELPTSSLVDPEGGIDRELFPNIARLADTSTWYRNHTSVAAATTLAVPALLSGTMPEETQRAPVHGEHPDNLISLLAPTHRIHAVEWVTELCPPSLCSEDPPDLDADAMALLDAPVEPTVSDLTTLLDQARALWWDQAWPPASRTPAEAEPTGLSDVGDLVEPGLTFLSGLVDAEDDDRPTFDYLHVPVPHGPWWLLPSGSRYDGPHPPPGAEFMGWSDDDGGEQLGLAARSRHLLQTQWADRLLGAIFDRMEELGRWDDAVVVLTSDHGISFRPGQPARATTAENQADIYWAPLIVKAPHQKASDVVDLGVRSIDVAPTVANLVDVGWPADGRALDGGGGPSATRRAVPYVSQAGREEGAEVPDVLELDEDAFATVLSGGRRGGDGGPGAPADELAAWRHGRHGELLGRAVAELGECAPGPVAEYEPPDAWTSYVDGTLDRRSVPVPLWHEARVLHAPSIDVAAAVDGRIVAWSVTRPTEHGMEVGLLFAEPLVERSSGRVVLYQVVTGDGCRLAPLRS